MILNTIYRTNYPHVCMSEAALEVRKPKVPSSKPVKAQDKILQGINVDTLPDPCNLSKNVEMYYNPFNGKDYTRSFLAEPDPLSVNNCFTFESAYMTLNNYISDFDSIRESPFIRYTGLTVEDLVAGSKALKENRYSLEALRSNGVSFRNALTYLMDTSPDLKVVLSFITAVSASILCSISENYSFRLFRNHPSQKSKEVLYTTFTSMVGTYLPMCTVSSLLSYTPQKEGAERKCLPYYADRYIYIVVGGSGRDVKAEMRYNGASSFPVFGV